MYGSRALIASAMAMASFFDDIMPQPMTKDERNTKHSKYCRALRRKLRAQWRK